MLFRSLSTQAQDDLVSSRPLNLLLIRRPASPARSLLVKSGPRRTHRGSSARPRTRHASPPESSELPDSFLHPRVTLCQLLSTQYSLRASGAPRVCLSADLLPSRQPSLPAPPTDRRHSTPTSSASMLPYSTTLFGTPPSPVAPLGPTPPPARPWYRSPPSVEPLPAGCSCSICQRETSAFGSSSYTRSSPATSASLAASPQPPSEPPHDYDACDCSVCTRMRDLKGVPETGLKKVKSRVKRLLGRMGVRSRTRREAAAEDLEDEQPPM